MVSAKANASEDVVPEFVGDLIPFDKARVTTSVSPWTARGGGWLCVEWGGGRRRTLKGHNAGASRQASTHGFVNWLGCVLGCQRWMRTTATRVTSDIQFLVILFAATFRCITLMPMKGEILVDTMEKTLKPGGFLKSGLIETEGPLEAVKGHL
ncbi:hypothetical protein CFC21_017768 [Triticum aestivum]|uniref:Uncharacterized protein n=3 Tax=Triticum TaxID=4564 RepID=A0A9R1NXH4_TRITD|nr:hypothetical protein CFC21_017768 [Triticum aestivum]VAH32967.1 unnamed protein product [Triticum turgidum subsp. durum]